MPFPNFIDKYSSKPIISPRKFWEYRKKLGIDLDIDPPDGVVFTFQSKLMTYIIKHYEVTKVEQGFANLYLLENSKGTVGLCGNFGIGAPITAILIEEFAAIGVKKFISIGTAGALQEYLKLGSIIVCDRAIRDEGTSHHYLPAEKYSYPSQTLTKSVITTIERLSLKHESGTSWTTDAPYRETLKEIENYNGEGVLTVDMEASAIFTVAKALNVEAASVFTISDSVIEKEWKPYFHLTDEHLHTLFRIAVETLNSV